MTVKLFELLALAREIFPESAIDIVTASGERCGWRPKDADPKSVVTVREERIGHAPDSA